MDMRKIYSEKDKAKIHAYVECGESVPEISKIIKRSFDVIDNC